MSAPRRPKQSIVIGDAEYLKALSGYKQKSAIANWCRKNGIKFFLNAQGWPVTTATALNSALLGVNAGPDWSAFDDWKTGTHWRHRRRRQEMGIPEPPRAPKGHARRPLRGESIRRRDVSLARRCEVVARVTRSVTPTLFGFAASTVFDSKCLF
jgi:hypothetical protein